MNTFERSLAGIAQTLKIEVTARSTDVVLAVNASAVLTLAFDQGEAVTPERLAKAITEHFIRQMDDAASNLFDKVTLLELQQT